MEEGTQPSASSLPSLPQVLACGVLVRQAEAPQNSLGPYLDLRRADLLGQDPVSVQPSGWWVQLEC